jgi:hypothetical protein
MDLNAWRMSLLLGTGAGLLKANHRAFDGATLNPQVGGGRIQQKSLRETSCKSRPRLRLLAAFRSAACLPRLFSSRS